MCPVDAVHVKFLTLTCHTGCVNAVRPHSLTLTGRFVQLQPLGSAVLPDLARAIAEHIGPILAARGLLLVGLDVIGSCLTEINVTSPTCFAEITQQTGFDVASVFIDAVETALRHAP